MTEITQFSTYKFKTPMKVSVFEIEGHYYATNNEFEIYADGNSEDAALELFNVYLEEMHVRAKKLVEMIE